MHTGVDPLLSGPPSRALGPSSVPIFLPGADSVSGCSAASVRRQSLGGWGRELQVPVGWVLYLTHHVIYHLSLTWGCRWRTTPPSIQVCPLLVVTLVVLMSKLFILSIAQFAWVTNKKTTTTIYLGEGGGFENLLNWVSRTLINMMF